MREQDRRILEAAVKTYGAYAQIDKSVEEMAELTQVLMRARCENWARETEEHVREEIADVKIMLEQLQLIFGDASDWEEAKLSRLARRLGLESA